MVFQNYALYPHMTVRDNMSFALMLAKTPEGRDRASSVRPRRRHPGPRAAARPLSAAASGGQRQRVAMGRAIVRDPQVFLFDEPLSNLDAKLRVQMRTEIKELHQRLKTTSIYVTHDQIEAMTMADKIVVMRDGIVEQTGAPLELYDRPVEHVRRRLHRLAGDEHDPRHRARNGAGDARRVRAAASMLPLPPARAPTTASAVLYGIRPEHLRAGDRQGLPVEVVVVEPTGADTQLVLPLRRPGRHRGDRRPRRLPRRRPGRPRARSRRGRTFSTRRPARGSPPDRAFSRSSALRQLEPSRTPRRSDERLQTS